MKKFILSGLALSFLFFSDIATAGKHHKKHHKHHSHSRSAESHSMVGIASWYGHESGNRTANGERFNPKEFTAAHRYLPFGTKVKVINGNKYVIVRINDRGPWVKNRVVDLSKGAAVALNMNGLAPVTLTVLD